MKFNEVLIAIRRLQYATLQELADVTGLSVSSIAANLGGLHDFGLVTKYGSHPHSHAKWEGIDTPWVKAQVRTARARGIETEPA